MTADRARGISLLGNLDDLIASYRDRYGEGKPYQILLAIRAMYGGAQPPGRIQRGKIIRAVWRDEIKQYKPTLQDSRVRLLSNTFSAHKKILNERFREMVKAGTNPRGLGLVTGEVFGVLDEEDIEVYARKIKSPWLVEDLHYRVELIDRKGGLAKVEKRTRLKALEPGLQNYPHEIRADGRTEAIEVSPGRKLPEEQKLGGVDVVQVFDPPFSFQESREVILRFNWVDAFRNEVEYLVHFVRFPQKGKTKIEVIFPKDRPYKRYEIYRGGVAGDVSLLQGGLKLEEKKPEEGRAKDGRPILRWEIEDPPHRERYRLVWAW
ncbi:MAG: hypothetical protein HW385_976 [candidate division NC10 bacterium]|nr:hypothetical protein [candidate division NC10 bacterium]